MATTPSTPGSSIVLEWSSAKARPGRVEQMGKVEGLRDGLDFVVHALVAASPLRLSLHQIR